MFASLDPRSPVPLYDQIAAPLRAAIATGALREGEPLASVRGLSTRLRVNPATVVQAYRQLEAEGFVEMRQGAGTFVKAVGESAGKRERSAQARRLVRTLLADAARLGISVADLTAALAAERDGRP